MARPKFAVGEIVDKNIKYRGEMQYSVEIRRKGYSVDLLAELTLSN